MRYHNKSQFEDLMDDFDADDYFATIGEDENDHDVGASQAIPAHGLHELSFQREDVDASTLLRGATPDLFPTVVAVIAQVKLGVPVELQALVFKVKNISYGNQKGRLVMKLKSPPCACLIHLNGIISVVGARDMKSAELAAHVCIRILIKTQAIHDPIPEAVSIRVRSVMACFDCGRRISLDALLRSHPACCSRPRKRTESKVMVTVEDPDRIEDWKVFCSVHPSGKVSMFGARSPRELQKAFYKLLAMLGDSCGHHD